MLSAHHILAQSHRQRWASFRSGSTVEFALREIIFIAFGFFLFGPLIVPSIVAYYYIGKSKPVQEIISTFHWRFVES